MKKIKLTKMAYIGLYVIFVCLTACNEKCEESHTNVVYHPVYQTLADIRSQEIKTESARALSSPGKIYFKDHHIFINEPNQGIHIIDNSDPVNPKNLRFIEIPGNVDMAIRNNTLYADSYSDLIALDISNLQDIKTVKRLENVFTNVYPSFIDTDGQEKIVVDWTEETVTSTVPCDQTYYVDPIL